MFSNDRNELRQVFFETWDKHQKQLPLTPLQAQLMDIIMLHPEYHALLNDPENLQENDFPEENPFLHLSLHLAIREQISTDRPAGINEIHRRLCHTFKDAHLAEHNMMECLGRVLWEAQKTHELPDENSYLEMLKQNL